MEIFSGNDKKVIVARDEVAAFNRSWPCSKLRDRAYWFEFDSNGDLIDTDVPEHDDGPEAAAMAEDCKAFLFDDVAPDWALVVAQRPDSGAMVQLTEETIKATRQWFADNAQQCIAEATRYVETGGLEGFRVNDLADFVAWQEQMAERALSGADDGCFAFVQRATLIQTGECRPLLAPIAEQGPDSGASVARHLADKMSGEEAWLYAAQWGSYINGSDPGRWMYCFSDKGTLPDENHRSEVLAYIRDVCIPLARDNDDEPDEDCPYSDVEMLERLASYVEALVIDGEQR